MKTNVVFGKYRRPMLDSLSAVAAGAMLLIADTEVAYSQGMGINNPTPHASALLDLTSKTRGLLIPRMTTAERDAIGTPANSLLIFNNTTNTYDYWDGAAWVSLLTSSGTSWTKSGNFVYTTTAGDSVGIGTTAPGGKFQVVHDALPANTILNSIILTRTAYGTNGANGIGTQFNFQDENSTGSVVNAATVGAMLSDATAGAEKGVLIFGTGSTGSLTEKVRIDENGNFGIGTAPGHPILPAAILLFIPIPQGTTMPPLDYSRFIPTQQEP